MGNRKRKKRGSNSSVHSEADMTNEDDVKHSIDTLTKAMEAGFASLHVELDKLRLEFKHEIDEMKDEQKSLKESISFTQDEVDTLKENRCRPIIARFISREDRNQIWQNRGKIKHSDNYPDAYITEDFAKAIQDERKVLIKAMMKARENEPHLNAKVVGRYLFINNEKFDYKNIPSYLK